MKTHSFLVRILLLCAVVSTALALTGCSVSVHDRDVPPGTSTVGRELIDLKRAYEAGAINQSEYESKKSELLERRH